MKKLLMFVMLLIFVITLSAKGFDLFNTQGDTVKYEYDKFDLISKWETKFMKMEPAKSKYQPELALKVYIIYKEKTSIRLAFYSFNEDGWAYLKSHNLIIIADTTRIDFGETKRSGNATGGSCLETLSSRIDMDNLKLLSESDTLQIKLGFRFYKTDYENIEPIRKIIEQYEGFMAKQKMPNP